MDLDIFIGMIAIFSVLVVIFLIARTIALWYFKIDERVLLMRENNALLRRLLEHSRPNDVSIEQKPEIILPKNEQ